LKKNISKKNRVIHGDCIEVMKTFEFMNKRRDKNKYNNSFIFNMKIKKICPIYKKEFLIEESRLKHGRGKHCSKECQYKAMKENSGIKLKCVVCGKEFKRSPSHIKSKYSFCSNECSYKGRSLGFVERNIIKPYNCYRKPKRKCLICNSEFIYHKNTQKYCSRKCFEIAHKDNMKGSKNPSWIDGRSYNKRGYRGEEWDHIRKEVYERDNYYCQECGVKCIGRKKINDMNGFLLIQCHHIDGNKENNELYNLETLCVKCHGKK